MVIGHKGFFSWRKVVHKENVLIERAQDFVRREMQAEKALARAARMLIWAACVAEYHAGRVGVENE
ncbi:MAG: hypothetical protein PHC94_13390, partial [Methylobacter sp.]|nr:hypothetical protein [Methylobacter sp.]